MAIEDALKIIQNQYLEDTDGYSIPKIANSQWSNNGLPVNVVTTRDVNEVLDLIKQALEKPRVMLPYTKDQKDRIKEIFERERWTAVMQNGYEHNESLDRIEQAYDTFAN